MFLVSLRQKSGSLRQKSDSVPASMSQMSVSLRQFCVSVSRISEPDFCLSELDFVSHRDDFGLVCPCGLVPPTFLYTSYIRFSVIFSGNFVIFICSVRYDRYLYKGIDGGSGDSRIDIRPPA